MKGRSSTSSPCRTDRNWYILPLHCRRILLLRSRVTNNLACRRTACTSVSCVPAAAPAAPVTGGTETSTSAPLSWCRWAPGRATVDLRQRCGWRVLHPFCPSGISLDDRLARWFHRGASVQAAGPVLALPLPHDHELHEDLSKGDLSAHIFHCKLFIIGKLSFLWLL